MSECKGMENRSKKSRRKWLLPSVCAVLVLCAIGVGVWVTASPVAESIVISGGIQQYASSAYLAASAPVGQSIGFDAAWFDRALGGGEVAAITVTDLPAVSEGRLMLGHSEVSVGQTILREALSFLSFAPNEGVRESSFGFVPADATLTCGYAVTCQLRVTDTVNCCPTGTKSVMAVSVHETLDLSGALTARDPEGDTLVFEICNYPANGTVFLDQKTGAFVYTPKDGYTGEDSFTWRVQDENGAFAPEATVNITVRPLGEQAVFDDMLGMANHTHALRVSEKGLLSGEKMGGKRYFHPQKGLTRAAFVAILLQAAEIQAPDAENTGFADNDEILPPMRGAVRYAREQGWIEDEERFRPNDVITRAEAAQIAARVLSLSAPKYSETVSDFDTIPTDVADAVYAIYEGGYISTSADGALLPMGELTRGDAAVFFAKVLDVKEQKH
ncbi:MAG: S-layer homology domain-containing protein [Clostridia bacterium]|nr:S-layer homology domain-containing protein [Clostridia bacterium]